MKKFLTFLGAISLIASSAMSVIACNTNSEDQGKDQGKDEGEDQGKDEVEDQGKDEGEDQGKDQGKDEGEDQGKDQGVEDQINFTDLLVLEPTEEQILTALKFANPNLKPTNISAIINEDKSTATINYDNKSVEITYKVQEPWQDLNKFIKTKNIEVNEPTEEEILKSLAKANEGFDVNQVSVDLYNNQIKANEAIIFANQNSKKYISQTTITFKVIDHTVDLSTVIDNKPIELFTNTQKEAMKEILKRNSGLDQNEVELEVLDAPAIIQIKAINNSLKYKGIVEIPYTLSQTQPLVLDEIINDKQISIFDNDSQSILAALVKNNPELDTDYLQVAINQEKEFAIISPTSAMPNKYSGSKRVYYQLESLMYNLNHLNLEKDYSDQELYKESVEIQQAKGIFDYYRRANSNAAKSPYQKELINFFYQYYLKNLSFQLSLFKNNYLNIQKIDGQIVPIKFKTNYFEEENFWSQIVVQKSRAQDFIKNNQGAVEAYVQPYLREELNKIFDQMNNKLLENILKSNLYYLYAYHFIQSKGDEISNYEIQAEITKLIIDNVPDKDKDQVKIGQDFTISDIKRDKLTGRLLGQSIEISATKESKFLKGHFMFTINKDFSYLYNLMNWTDETQMVNNKLMILNEINRWTDTSAISQINHYYIALSENDSWVLWFNELSPIMSGRETDFEIIEPSNKTSLDWLNMKINLDETNETLTDDELKTQINSFINQQKGLELVADEDWEIQGIIERDQETGKLLGQKIIVKAKDSSTKIQGIMEVDLKKDFSYLHDLMDWSNNKPETIMNNKLIAINEIERWSKDLLNGFDYYFEPNENGFLTLKFNPSSDFIGGPDLVFEI